jgi:hypothetical protein
VFLQGLRRRQIGIEEFLQKRARRLLAGAPLGVVLAALGVELRNRLVERRHETLSPPDTRLNRPSLRG